MKICDLQNGDLLFVRGFSAMSKAIVNIEKDSKFSHVGIYFDGLIYHATKKYGVTKQNLSLYLDEEDCVVCVYRYPDLDVAKVKSEAEKYLGLPYNHSFYPDDKGFYCSEYVADILPVFDTVKMQFGDGEVLISEYWQNYYSELGLEVPVGQEGTNPNQLSQSDKLIYIDVLEF